MTTFEKGIKQEFELARQMKECYCDKSGRETDAAKAAEILHKIGLIYRKRSPDKIALIKSAGLFNAAIVRNPPNISQIKSDLYEICEHILQQGKAKNRDANLVKKAEQVKGAIVKLRKEIDTFIRNVPKVSATATGEELKQLNLKKISTTHQINKSIGNKYKQIMAELSQYCEDVMGKPPCKYSIAGMGSLAREEITPYSDFEHIILLFDDKNFKLYLEYFKWFSVIFHVIVINIQESIIPSLNICSLNDTNSRLGDWYYDAITPRGISFDGMMPHACKFPLGRQQHTKNKPFETELIKPVSEMLEYLGFEADLKNGYHLADILTKTCFVFGNKNIFKQFVDGAQNYRDKKSNIDIINEVQQQVKDDLKSFSTRFRLTNLKLQATINIKTLVYRSTTIFIAAMARIHKISANSCFDMINEMTDKNIITQNTAYKLRCAIATACEMRLRVYAKNNSQCDNAIVLKQGGVAEFLNVVGVASTINYFQIAYCLQCEVAKQLHFSKLHFYSDPQLINITISIAFGMKDLTNFFKDSQKDFWVSSKFDFDKCIEQLEEKINLNSSISDYSVHSLSYNQEQIKSIADYLLFSKIYDEALDFYQQLLEIYQSKQKVTNRDFDIAWANNQIGLCLIRLYEPESALKYLNRALEIKKTATSNVDNDPEIARTLHNIGRCCIDLHNYDDAIIHLNKALEIRQNVTVNANFDKDIASTLHTIGRCHHILQQDADALIYLHQALEIYQKATLDSDMDKDIAVTLNSIGRHYVLHNYEDSLAFSNKSLGIKQNITPNANSDKSLALTIHTIGWCHVELHQYDRALKFLDRAFEINKNISLDVDKDRELAIVECNIGVCLTGLRRYDDSWKCLENSLKVLQTTTLDEKKDSRIADAFDYMGECLIGKQKYEEALTHLQRAEKMYHILSTNKEKDVKYSRTLYNTGLCLMELHKNADALNYFRKTLDIYEKMPLNKHIKSKIFLIHSKMDQCSAKRS